VEIGHVGRLVRDAGYYVECDPHHHPAEGKPHVGACCAYWWHAHQRGDWFEKITLRCLDPTKRITVSKDDIAAWLLERKEVLSLRAQGAAGTS
jgi:hypothetical protein